ncbi:MAG: septum formation protein Maf [Clostridia bacterium]|nr:septum formation protein Maf [Clostridia bacterium]
MKITTPVILASASPRRKELIGLCFENVSIIPSDAEEIIDKNARPEEVTLGLSLAKARSVAALHHDTPVIGCDTVVIKDGRILTKPKDRSDAVKMLKELSGAVHTVSTGCSIVYGGREHSFFELTSVRFWELPETLIESYVDSGEPMDKAGAYGIQKLGSLLVREINGDYFNVVGLPVSRLYREFISFIGTTK